MSIGDNTKALTNYQEALSQVQKKGNDKSRNAKILYNMAIVYRKMNNIEKAK